MATVLSLASLFAGTRPAFAQPVEEPVAEPEPGADALPSETPPPPPLPPEPPPSPPVTERPSWPAAFRPLIPPADAPPTTDLTLPFAASSLALGGVLLLSGGIAYAAAPGGEEYCTVTGCVTRPAGRELENIGADLMGAGGGFALVGGIGMLAWADSRPRGTERRHSVPMMTAGFSMTAFGAAGFGLGLGQTLTYAHEPDTSTSWPLFFTSGVLLASGIPLWVIGANNRDAEERALRAEQERVLADPRVAKTRRSVPRVVGGAILTGLGGLGGLAGTGIFLFDMAAGGPSFVSAIIAAPCLGAGALFAGIGVPLIVSGNEKVPEGSRVADPLMPAITAGPAGLAASWRFE